MSGNCGGKTNEIADCDVDLARTSVGIAVFLEVIGLEGGIHVYLSHSLPMPYNILLMLAVKAMCLVLIFAPLVVYVHRHGLRALKFVKARVALVALIVVLHFGGVLFMLLGLLRRAGVI